MVVTLIIILMSTYILLQQSKFNSSTLLRSLAYSVALSVRQAQVYGTSVRESAVGSGVFASGYGVNFVLSTPTQYTLFPDLPSGAVPGNGQYDSSTEGPPKGTVFKIANGYTLSKFCAQETTGTMRCTDSGVGAINRLTVYFRRPNTDACISTDSAPSVCAQGATAAYNTAYVQVQSTRSSDSRVIKMTTTGQITVCSALNLSDFTQC
jgi:hypothetical protein